MERIYHHSKGEEETGRSRYETRFVLKPYSAILIHLERTIVNVNRLERLNHGESSRRETHLQGEGFL